MSNPRLASLAVLAACAVPLWLGACGDDSSQSNANDNGTTQPPICGNGVVEAGEECDSGAANSDTIPDACRTDCREPYCGDAITDSGEGCDLGPYNADIPDAPCRLGCTLPACGDGVRDSDEACDDGDDVNGDGCNDRCEQEAGWTCTGQPSTCVCAPYWGATADCSHCRVYVSLDATAATPDGLTWATAYRDLQTAVDTAAQATDPACEVWVAQGRYRVFEHNLSDTLSLRSGVALYGGFGGDETAREDRDPVLRPTHIDGRNEQQTLSVRHVITADSVEDATLDGFVVEGGLAQGAFQEDGWGGGLLLRNASLGVAGCTFTDNAALSTSGRVCGGAIFAQSSQLTLRNTAVLGDERSRNALYAEDSDVLVDGCELAIGGLQETLISTYGFLWIRDSRIAGTPIRTDHGETRLENVRFATHSAVAFELRQGTLEATQLELVGNSAYPLPGGYAGTPTTGFDIDIDSEVYLRQSTLTRVGELVVGGSTPFGQAWTSLHNSIAYGIAETGTLPFSLSDVSHSDVQGLGPAPASGIIDAAPSWNTANLPTGLFAPSFSAGARPGTTTLSFTGESFTPGALAGTLLRLFDGLNQHARIYAYVIDNSEDELTVWGVWSALGLFSVPMVFDFQFLDHHLTAGSAGIDAADAASAPPTDLDGNPRTDGDGDGTTLPDMGAYEYQP